MCFMSMFRVGGADGFFMEKKSSSARRRIHAVDHILLTRWLLPAIHCSAFAEIDTILASIESGSNLRR